MSFVASGLACTRGGRVLYDNLSFALAPGEALLVAGANGSGKSSLLRQLAGLAPLEAGRLEHPAEALAEHCHYLGHADGVKTALSVRENLAFWRALFGGSADFANLALIRLALHPLADLPARVLSAGQRRRVALSRLLLAQRPVWVLDEPDAALDREGRALLAALIEEHREAGGIAIVAGHGTFDFSPARELRLGEAGKPVA
jgi:heme exporter protein A